MGAALDAFIEYKLTDHGPWELWTGGLDYDGHPTYDEFIPRGQSLYALLGWLPGDHRTRFQRKGKPPNMSVGLENFIYNWADYDVFEQMSYLSFSELVDAATIWDDIIEKDGGDPGSATVTLQPQRKLARALLAGTGLDAPAYDVRMVYWFT